MIVGSSEYARNPRILGLCVHPGMILRLSDYSRIPRILGQVASSAVSILRLSWNCQSIPGILTLLQDVPSIPGMKGGLQTFYERRIIGVSQESRDTQRREVELCPSRDDPGIVRVSQDSQDIRSMPKHVQSNLRNPLRIIDILWGYWTSLSYIPYIFPLI